MRSKLISLFFLAPFVLALSDSAFGASPSTTTPEAPLGIKMIEAVPSEMFAKQLTSVRIRVKFDRPGKHQVSLVQIDAHSPKPRLIGIMTDEGVAGDQFVGDGVFTRKFKVVHHVVEDIEYGIMVNDNVLIQPSVKITVKKRPSFIQMIQQAWNHMTS